MPRPERNSRKEKDFVVYLIRIFINGGDGGSYDDTSQTPIDEYELKVRVKPTTHFNEETEVNKHVDRIMLKGYTHVTEDGTRTYYPAHRIDRVEAIKED